MALKDWYAADDNCRASYGGSLVAPSTQLENAYIKQQLTENYGNQWDAHVWMGAYKYLNYTTNLPEWRFSNGEPYFYEDWAFNGFDSYGRFTGPSFLWDVSDGRIAYPYICEHKL